MKIVYNLKSLILIFFILFFSCNNDGEVVEPTIENIVNIDGETYEVCDKGLFGNENCDILYITATARVKELIIRIEFNISVDGELLKVKYHESDMSGVINYFLTPNFNPTATFSISNFNYNTTTGDVNFNFDGTVFHEKNNDITRAVFGNIKIEALEKIACSISKTGLSFNSNELNLFSFYNDITEYSDGRQLHQFFSNNGYSIYMHVSGDLWNYPLGEMEFSENSTQNSVEFKEAIAPFIADQGQFIEEQKWKDYQTSGKIIIEKKYIENNQKVISGKLVLTIKDNGKLVYFLNGIEFKTRSFKD